MNKKNKEMEHLLKFYGNIVGGVILFYVLSVSCSVAQDAQLMVTPDSETQAEYIIGLGDQLQVMVWKEPELTQTMSVRMDGRISLPLVGDVEAAGKTIRDLKKNIEEKYAVVIAEPAVSVMLAQSKSWRYYIIGKVAHPGEYPIDFPITVLQALAKSGGFLEWAQSDKISFVRRENGRETILLFNYEELAKGKDLKNNAMVKPGDTIIVP